MVPEPPTQPKGLLVFSINVVIRPISAVVHPKVGAFGGGFECGLGVVGKDSEWLGWWLTEKVLGNFDPMDELMIVQP